MTRQHYALGLQNRMVVLEFKQRYFEIFNKRSDETAEKLKFDQIAALRFTYDDEFKELLYRALHENISGDEIKRSIKNGELTGSESSTPTKIDTYEKWSFYSITILMLLTLTSCEAVETIFKGRNVVGNNLSLCDSRNSFTDFFSKGKNS